MASAAHRLRITAVDSPYGNVKSVPWQDDMLRPQVADEEDSLQIWRAAANVLKQQ
jgi:hypothetical protein